MEAKAIAKYVRMSPIKLKPVTDLVRGKDLDEALNILKFTPGKGAEIVEKVVMSARNIPTIKTALTNTINVYDILKGDTLVLTKDAVAKIEEVYA